MRHTRWVLDLIKSLELDQKEKEKLIAKYHNMYDMIMFGRDSISKERKDWKAKMKELELKIIRMELQRNENDSKKKN